MQGLQTVKNQYLVNREIDFCSNCSGIHSDVSYNIELNAINFISIFAQCVFVSVLCVSGVGVSTCVFFTLHLLIP